MSDGVPRHVLELPCWSGPVTAVPLAGGLSNESWKVTDAAGTHVARFGTDIAVHHVERTREAMVARAAHAAGFAPAVEYSAAGVMVSVFVAARTWTSSDVSGNPVRIADMLQRFHRELPAHMHGTAVIFWPFHVIRDYARTLTADASPFLPEVGRLLRMSESFEAAQLPLPIVFGHHDLLPANFLDDGERLWLIDFEYAGFGTAMFDLASAAANAMMQDEDAEILLSTYFCREPDGAMWRAFDAMQAAALVREAMWAMVSDTHLFAPGVDYKTYVRENMEKLESFLQRYQLKHGKIGT